MTRLWALVLLGLGVSFGAAFADVRPAWRSWDEGLREARRTQRPILVNVHTQWCGWCKRMDRQVYSRPDVREYLGKNFVTIKLDAEAGEPARYRERTFTGRSLAAHFRVTGYPTTVFLKADGEHLISVPGYVEGDQFLQVLRYIGGGHLERGVSWEEFQGGSE